ncbi:hypothetical protein NXS19_012914 [Fusarium pseudograminearum]|nr:hypothetical protein NXS19_012914 [Fusarium pseudograminearum]
MYQDEKDGYANNLKSHISTMYFHEINRKSALCHRVSGLSITGLPMHVTLAQWDGYWLVDNHMLKGWTYCTTPTLFVCTAGF